MSTSPIIVTVRDVREARLCTRGLRTWLTTHGFDVGDFVRHGAPIEKLEATGDAMALHVCERARARVNEGARDGRQ